MVKDKRRRLKPERRRLKPGSTYKQYQKPTPAERVIQLFGNAYRLAEALERVGYKIAPVTVYRWNYPANKKGRGGFIPPQAWPFVVKAARLEGILLTSFDLDPRILRPSYDNQQRYGRQGLYMGVGNPEEFDLSAHQEVDDDHLF